MNLKKKNELSLKQNFTLRLMFILYLLFSDFVEISLVSMKYFVFMEIRNKISFPISSDYTSSGGS